MRHDAERILMVHAYPTDEVVSTGGTIAALLTAGASVSVLTCTRGELADVAPDPGGTIPGDPAGVGELREREARIALSTLGVTDHRFLGAPAARQEGLPPRRYLDSGSKLKELTQTKSLAILDPDCLLAAPLEEVALDIDAVVRQVQPTAIVTCDADGPRVRPDHIKVYQAVVMVGAARDIPVFAVTQLAGEDVKIDVLEQLGVKKLALAAHSSQVFVTEDGYRTTTGDAIELADTERYRVIPTRTRSEAAPRWPEAGGSLLGFLISVAASFIAGFLVGFVATVNHQSRINLFGLDIIIGLVLGVAAVTMLLVGFRFASSRTLFTALAAAGVLLAVIILSLRGISGAMVVPWNLRGIFWITVVPVIGALCVLWPSWDRIKALRHRGARRAAAHLSGIMKRLQRQNR